ncbi:hypothetical protein NQ318_015984, partial [Aromia moschata]
KWIIDSYNYWADIKDSPEGAKAGVTDISGYIFSSEYPNIVRNHYLERLVPIYRPASEGELKLCPGNWRYGSFFTTLLTQCTLYLPWAMKKFLDAGGKILEKKVTTLSSVGLHYDVVVNCTGLGAKYLCDDHKLVPVRGQVIKIQCDTAILMQEGRIF